jgi:hypothetical protein
MIYTSLYATSSFIFSYLDIQFSSLWTGQKCIRGRKDFKATRHTVVVKKVLLIPKIPLLQSQGLYPAFQKYT